MLSSTNCFLTPLHFIVHHDTQRALQMVLLFGCTCITADQNLGTAKVCGKFWTGFFHHLILFLLFRLKKTF